MKNTEDADVPREPPALFCALVLVFGLILLAVGADRALVFPFLAAAETCKRCFSSVCQTSEGSSETV
jgi:hypothetical protein